MMNHLTVAQNMFIGREPKKGPDPSAPHYALSLVLVDTGEEVRLHAATSGGSQKYFISTSTPGEGELAGVLKQTLDIWDEIIL